MPEILNAKGLFDPKLVKDLIDRVKGRSALVVLAQQEPIPFSGKKEFTFNMDDEVDLVAESGKKSRGSASLEPVTIVPLKVEYGFRTSDEFLYASEEEQIEVLKAFNDGFAKKVARGLDLMAMHGVNPRTGEESTLIGNNCFDKAVTQKVSTGDTADAKVESAIALVDANDEPVTGMAMAPALRSDLAAMTNTATGAKLYPELAWGNTPGAINGLPVQVNPTVSANNSGDLGIVGNFELFKWGYAKEIPMEIIRYGDPDNSGRDLKGYNEIYIRSEVYLGWGILDAKAFARIIEST